MVTKMNNGELTTKKALLTVQSYKTDDPDLKEYCESVVFMESLTYDIIESMEWMLTQLKWKHRSQLNMEDEKVFPDKDIPWSPEMKKAMKVLEKLKQG